MESLQQSATWNCELQKELTDTIYKLNKCHYEKGVFKFNTENILNRILLILKKTKYIEAQIEVRELIWEFKQDNKDD